MKTTKKILWGFLSVVAALYQVPCVIAHEWLHILFARLFGKKTMVVHVTFTSMSWRVCLDFTEPITSKVARFFIVFSVFLIPISAIIMAHVFVYGWIAVIYVLSLLFTFHEGRLVFNGIPIPSEADFKFYKDGNQTQNPHS